MKYLITYISFLIFSTRLIHGQDELSDTARTIKLNDVIISAERLPVALKRNTGSVSLVTPEILSGMPRSAAIEEALRLVPGVRIDNQHDGERVHVSIRGQGILTERGLRGIGVQIDGIPVNDPSGFAPDLYDVDWGTVKNIQVLRGPLAGLYGGSGAAGVLNIITNNGGTKSIGGTVSQCFGSNGFIKSLLEADGSRESIDYRISYSHSGSDGYRDHQAFRSDKLYEKINFRPSKNLTLTQIVSYTKYFQQNPEGLNISQFDNLRQANPDALPFNEYKKTVRTTLGLIAGYRISDLQDILVTSYIHASDYKETSNKCAEYRDITFPGASFIYNLHPGNAKIKNLISLGIDLKWQNITIYKLQSAADTLRQESIDESNIETDSLLANQIISQKSIGAFALYKLEAGKFTLTGSLRYDEIKNELTDKITGPGTAPVSVAFRNFSAKAGASYSFINELTLYANLSNGFMPPSTEELASNPEGYSGFNTHLVPATSVCSEMGIRGSVKDRIFYEITGFIMNTKNDFFRFKQSGRGNQEVFYGNAGNSKRFGIEMYASFNITKNFGVQVAYTFSDYKYTSAEIDPVYTDPEYVLTVPPEPGQWLPNSPRHQLYSEISYTFLKKLRASIGTEWQSQWAIYTDARAYSGELDPAIYQNWQKGFNLFNAVISYNCRLFGLKTGWKLSARNIFGSQYMAFTEPDPDGNAYHPGPGREFFGTLKIEFNH